MEVKKYGTDPALDKLVNDKNWQIRIKAAKIGYGLDELVYDDCLEVLYVIIEQGYGFDEILKYNQSKEVKKAIKKYLKNRSMTLQDWFKNNKLDFEQYKQQMISDGNSVDL